jgi:hypothetical protein
MQGEVNVLAEDRLALRQAAVEQAERALRGQRAELLRMMTEVRRLQEVVRHGGDAEREALRRENEQLRHALAGRDQAAPAPALPPEAAEELDRLRGEARQLRLLVEEKDALLQELTRRPPAGREASDLESYEAELNQFRLQLQEDRRRISDDLEQLRARKQELDTATREAEMELSRERAELARERTRLERLRDEVRIELERCQRDAAVLNRLSPVQRLREQLLGDREEA